MDNVLVNVDMVQMDYTASNTPRDTHSLSPSIYGHKLTHQRC